MESLKDKVVLITGSSSGIGAATAVLFAKYGSCLVLTGRNEANLNRTAKLCTESGLAPEKIKIVTGDVTRDDDLAKIVDVAVTSFSTIDILVNNAAAVLESGGNFQVLSMEELDLTYRTNLRAVVYLTKLVIPYLKKNKGSIINISSIVGARPTTSVVAYSLMKAAVEMFTRDLALELATDGIRVNCVIPSVIVTPIHDQFVIKTSGASTEEKKNLYYNRAALWHPLGRVGQAEEVAQSIVFLASEASSFTTGAILPIDGGFCQTSSWTPPAAVNETN